VGPKEGWIKHKTILESKYLVGSSQQKNPYPVRRDVKQF
jgi:hypothetical protein